MVMPRSMRSWIRSSNARDGLVNCIYRPRKKVTRRGAHAEPKSVEAWRVLLPAIVAFDAASAISMLASPFVANASII